MTFNLRIFAILANKAHTGFRRIQSVFTIMQNFDNIRALRITGIDEKRPPLILKAPYIDLFFKLSHKVPEDWADLFNKTLTRSTHPIKINNKEGLFIETYVRKSDEIVPLLDKLKKTVKACNEAYIADIESRAAAKEAAYLASKPAANPEQDALDNIVENLNFDT